MSKEVQKFTLDMDYMASILNFVYNNNIITKYINITKKKLFEKGWNVINNNSIILLFEKPIFKKYIEDFLFKLYIFQKTFGFCIYYVVKDIFKWVNKYEKTIKKLGRDINIHDNFINPFGFINIDLVNIYYETEQNKIGYKLNAIPRNERLLLKYEFFVLNFNFNEEKIRIPNYLLVNNNSRNFFDYIENQQNDKKTTLIKPRSIFSQIKISWFLIQEAILSRGDANFMSTHPETFIIPAPLKDVPLENIASDNLYAMDDLENAQDINNQKRSRVLLSYAQETLEGIRQSSSLGITNDINIRKTRKAIFSHTDMMDGIQMIPAEASQIHSTHSPQSIIDIEQELSLFEKNIADIFSLPYQLYSEKQKTEKKNKGGSSVESIIKIMENEINNIQFFISDIFFDIYQNSFGKIENFILKEKITIKKDIYLYDNSIIMNSTQLQFYNQKVIFDEKILILVQLFEKGIVGLNKILPVIDEWI